MFFKKLKGLSLNTTNLLSVLINIELMFFSIIIIFVISTNYYNIFENFQGQIFALCLITVAGAETAVGLGLLLVCFRGKSTVNIKDYRFLKG
jgi:NADH:ubiquinone oxidoreductase subunit K